jgi:predicted small lipoprotein YifL
MHPTLRTALHLAALAWLVLLLAVLAACGGGGDDEAPPPDKTTQPVDCITHPELCK